MVERRISGHRYLVAGLITVLIFSLGMSLGLVWDSKRIEWVQRENKLRDLDYQSLQFQYLYLSTLQSNRSETCSVLYTTLEQSVKDLGQTLDALIAYQKDSSINDEQYRILERDYVLDNFRYWLFAKQVQEACDKDIVTVLYFHTTYGCPECDDQGTLLTHYKKMFEDRLLIFPIDADLKRDEISISMIEARYNITEYPSLVIKYKKYEGLIESGKLHSLICSSFKRFQDECK